MCHHQEAHEAASTYKARYLVGKENVFTLTDVPNTSTILLILGTRQPLRLWALIWHEFLFIFLVLEETVKKPTCDVRELLRLRNGVIPFLGQHLTISLF